MHQSCIANLDVMPCGTRRDQTSEQFLQPAYRELLSGLRERYDVVIVDSPGILTASHALTIAELSDYVLVTMSLQPHSRPHLHESIGFLRQIGCNSVGLIVNEYPYAKGYHRIGFVSGFQSTPASMAPEYAINRLELASNG